MILPTSLMILVLNFEVGTYYWHIKARLPIYRCTRFLYIVDSSGYYWQPAGENSWTIYVLLRALLLVSCVLGNWMLVRFKFVVFSGGLLIWITEIPCKAMSFSSTLLYKILGWSAFWGNYFALLSTGWWCFLVSSRNIIFKVLNKNMRVYLMDLKGAVYHFFSI